MMHGLEFDIDEETGTYRFICYCGEEGSEFAGDTELEKDFAFAAARQEWRTHMDACGLPVS